MSFIEKTEKKFGKYSIGGLTMKLAVLQCIFFLFYMLKFDSQPIMETLYNLNIGGTTIISDLLLIVGSPVILPDGNFIGILFMFFGTQIFIILGTSLEELWGTYRYNLYILTCIIMALTASQVMQLFTSSGLGIQYTSTINLSLLFAFATFFPAFKILLFFFLPTPIRLIAFISFGGLIFSLTNMNSFDMIFWISASICPYCLFHANYFLNQQKQKSRAISFEKKVTAVDRQTFHKCNTCGKTENDNLEFRIAEDGEEYCLEHLK